jgi:hypothetical protein
MTLLTIKHYFQSVLRNRNRNYFSQRNLNHYLIADLSGTGPVINYGFVTGPVIKWNDKSSHRHSIKLRI